MFILNNLATEVQNIAKGVIIVAAVLLQRRASREATHLPTRRRPRAAAATGPDAAHHRHPRPGP